MNPLIEQLLSYDKLEGAQRGIIRPENVSKPYFTCPICRSHSTTVEEMMECFHTALRKGNYAIGDLVILLGKWTCGPAQSEDPWCAFILPSDPKNEDHFRHVHQHWYWFVVTGFSQDGHREICTVCSLMHQHVTIGWNPTSGNSHFPMLAEGATIDRKFWGPLPVNFIAGKMVPTPTAAFAHKMVGLSVPQEDGSVAISTEHPIWFYFHSECGGNIPLRHLAWKSPEDLSRRVRKMIRDSWEK